VPLVAVMMQTLCALDNKVGRFLGQDINDPKKNIFIGGDRWEVVADGYDCVVHRNGRLMPHEAPVVEKLWNVPGGRCGGQWDFLHTTTMPWCYISEGTVANEDQRDYLIRTIPGFGYDFVESGKQRYIRQNISDLLRIPVFENNTLQFHWVTRYEGVYSDLYGTHATVTFEVGRVCIKML
jgi:hypothetical protein